LDTPSYKHTPWIDLLRMLNTSANEVCGF